MEPIITGWKRYVLVQPPMMMLLFAQAMSGTILTDLIVYRTCRITLGINKTECLILHQNSSSSEALRIDAEVQPQASLIILCKSFIESIIPAFFSLFLGPWSDKYGRKPLILSGYLGISLTFFLLSVMADWDISPWFLLIAFVPFTIFGGFCILILATICYISDITDDHDRAWQLAWMEALISLGVFMGIFVGPIIFDMYGYTCVFGVAALLCILAGSYVLFCVPETVGIRGTSRTWGSLFDVSLVKGLVKTCIKKRDGFDRSIVWCCIMCRTLAVINMEGDITVTFLFTSARLGWNVKEYSLYSGSSVILGVVGILIGVRVIGRYTGISETIMAIFAIASSLGAAIVKAFTWKPWHMYLAVVAGMFGGILSPTIRATLSKSAPPEDTGKVFSLTASLETVTPFGAASLYGMIYSHYMPPLYPSPVWLVSVVLWVVIMITSVYVHIQTSKINTIRYASLTQNTE